MKSKFFVTRAVCVLEYHQLPLFRHASSQISKLSKPTSFGQSPCILFFSVTLLTPMTEKNIFVYKLFLSLNISDFSLFFYVKSKR